MERKVTDEDIVMLKYFWQEKGSIERYYDFKEIIIDLQVNYPQIFKAWYDYKGTEIILNDVIGNLELKD